MKKIYYQHLILVVNLFLIFSCSAPKIVYDYDKDAKFDLYKTFAIYPDVQLNMNQLDRDRVLKHLESAMLVKGFKKSNDPDVYVNIGSEQFETPSNSSIGIGLGTGGSNGAVGMSGGIPIRSNSLTQIFKVDIIDVRKDALIWQGTYEGKTKMQLTPEEKNEEFRVTFEKIFSKYPPGEK